MSRLYSQTESRFKSSIEPSISEVLKKPGRPIRICYYKFFCAVLYIHRTGISWRDLPSEYGHWHTIYTRYKKWSESGVFCTILYKLQAKKKVLQGVVFVDGSIIPVHRHGGGALKNKGSQSIGRGRRGLSTTLHLAITQNSFVNCMLFPGQRQDSQKSLISSLCIAPLSIALWL